jgi:uncharacterized protein YjdB
MNRLFHSILFSAVLLASFSCTDFQEDETPDSFCVDATELVFSATNDARPLTITSGTKWDVTSMPSWIRLQSVERSGHSPYEWTVTFVATANEEYNRDGVIALKASSETSEVIVIQEGKKGKYVAVESVSLSPEELTLAKGDSRLLDAIVLPSTASDKSVTWSSSNTSVATVSSSGAVTAKAVGRATITATTNDGEKKASCSVTVIIPVSSVRLDKTSLQMLVGDTQVLIPTVTPSDASDKSVIWSSSNTNVATVSSDGLVTANASGKATILVTTVDGGLTASCEVSVSRIPVTGVSLDKSSLEMLDGTSTTLFATVYPYNATSTEVSWSTSDVTVATVSNGLVSACNPGLCTITVTTLDGSYSASCSVIVKSDPSPSVWDGRSVSYDWYSRGTNGIYHIKTAAELAGLSKSFSQGYYKYGDFSGCTFYLDRDMDLASYEWTPIGTMIGNTYYTFAASFDGNGHEVKGMMITKSTNSTSFVVAGLFGCAFNGFSVKNLTVSGEISINAPTNLVGMFCVGGIVGYVDFSPSSIVNCHSNVDIYVNATTGNYITIYGGGIVGAVSSDCPFERCSSKGLISVTLDSTNKARIGGVVGQYNVSSTIISRCSSSSIITVSSGKSVDVGGIAGTTSGCNEIVNSIYSGIIEVNSPSYAFVAGIVGDPFSSIIARNCLMVGSYSKHGGTAYLSAIYGVNSSDLFASNTYYLDTLSSSTSFGMPISSEVFKSGSPISGFDTSIWNFPPGAYPYLVFD